MSHKIYLLSVFVCLAFLSSLHASLKEGDLVPAGLLRSMEGKEVDVAEISKGKPVVLIFYRGGWCPYCNFHLADLQTIDSSIGELEIPIYAISPDNLEELEKSVDKHALSYTLLSDSKMEVAEAFGIGFTIDEEMVQKYKGYGIDLEGASGETHHKLPHPAVFLVNQGRIIFAHVSSDYKVRLPASEILEKAKFLFRD
jgi:peroxiredoxin